MNGGIPWGAFVNSVAGGEDLARLNHAVAGQLVRTASL